MEQSWIFIENETRGSPFQFIPLQRTYSINLKANVCLVENGRKACLCLIPRDWRECGRKNVIVTLQFRVVAQRLKPD